MVQVHIVESLKSDLKKAKVDKRQLANELDKERLKLYSVYQSEKQKDAEEKRSHTRMQACKHVSVYTCEHVEVQSCKYARHGLICGHKLWCMACD